MDKWSTITSREISPIQISTSPSHGAPYFQERGSGDRVMTVLGLRLHWYWENGITWFKKTES